MGISRPDKDYVALALWEVDEDNEGCAKWHHFEKNVARIQKDKVGLEPRKLYNIIEFMMYDVDKLGTIRVNDALEMIYNRFGREALADIDGELFTDVEKAGLVTFTEFERQIDRIHLRAPKRRGSLCTTTARVPYG